jgi:hypothetical protein
MHDDDSGAGVPQNGVQDGLTGWVMRALALFLILTLLAACGPRFETRYSYTAPPESPQSRQCLQGCEFQRQQCLIIADNRYQICELEARDEAAECAADARYDYRRCLRRNQDDPEACQYRRAFCPRRACWRDAGNCDELYRACYVACGGSIQAETVCTANCDELPATPVPAAP